jgi:hypothetical protein
LASQYIKLPVVSGGGGGAGVDSFNGRTGVVVSQAGDYSAALISNVPAGTISSTNVQGAVNELDTDVQANAAAIVAINAALANKQPLDAELTAISNLVTDGIMAKTGAGTVATRTITAGSNIAVTNGSGVSGDPTIALSGIVPVANGGLGVNTAPPIGAVAIGNGTGYVVNQIAAGTGISITNGAGTISITNTNPANQNIDGGTASSVYGGTYPINGGNA